MSPILTFLFVLAAKTDISGRKNQAVRNPKWIANNLFIKDVSQ